MATERGTNSLRGENSSRASFLAVGVPQSSFKNVEWSAILLGERAAAGAGRPFTPSADVGRHRTTWDDVAEPSSGREPIGGPNTVRAAVIVDFKAGYGLR